MVNRVFFLFGAVARLVFASLLISVFFLVSAAVLQAGGENPEDEVTPNWRPIPGNIGAAYFYDAWAPTNLNDQLSYGDFLIAPPAENGLGKIKFSKWPYDAIFRVVEETEHYVIFLTRWHVEQDRVFTSFRYLFLKKPTFEDPSLDRKLIKFGDCQNVDPSLFDLPDSEIRNYWESKERCHPRFKSRKYGYFSGWSSSRYLRRFDTKFFKQTWRKK